MVRSDASADAAGDEVRVDPNSQCSTPSGAQICGGPGKCSGHCDAVKCGFDAVYGATDEPRFCLGTGQAFGRSSGGDCNACEDGNICFLEDARVVPGGLTDASVFGFMACGKPEIATFLTRINKESWLRYSDRSAWTGMPLPTPNTCPSYPGLPLCGGPCGGCPQDQICIGRSPLHPFSICVPAPPTGPSTCKRGNTCWGGAVPRRCLTFKVDDASQPIADYSSLCIPSDACDAAAKYLPGGAFCGPP